MSVEKPYIKTVYVDGKRVLRYTIPDNVFEGDDLESIGDTSASYTLTVPKNGFRKNFRDNELWYQMKNYSDVEGVTMSAVVRCLNAQKDIIATYNANSLLDDGSNPLQLSYNDGSVNIPFIDKTRVYILNKNFIKRGDYLYVKAVNGGDYPLAGIPIKINVAGVTYTKITDSNGICKLQINLNQQKEYTFTAWFENPLETTTTTDGVSTTTKKDIIVEDRKPLSSEKITANITVLKPRETSIKTFTKRHTSKLSSDKKTLTLYAVYGTNFIYQLTDTETGDPIPNRTVYCIIGGKKKTATTDYDGLARYYVDLKEGTYTAELHFDGDKYYDVSVDEDVTTKIVVQHKTSCKFRVRNQSTYDTKSKRTIYNASYHGQFFPVFCENSSGKSLGIPNKSVTVTYVADEMKVKQKQKDKKTGKIITVTKNKTITKTYTTSYDGYLTVPLNGLSKGKHEITLNYNGDYSFNKITSKFIVNITKNTSTKLISMNNDVCTPEDEIVVKLQTAYNEPLSNQKVTMSSKFGDQTVKTNTYGSAFFKINWEDGDYDISFKADKLTGEYMSPKTVSKTINVTGKTVYDLSLITPIDMSIMTMHLTIPEKVNDETEYLEFVFYMIPESTVTKDEEGNIKSISNDKVKVYFRDFMVNSGSNKAEYSETNKSLEIIDFNNTYFALLYPQRELDKGLEIIRPLKDRMSSSKIVKSNRTVFAPFYKPTIKEDRAEAVCKEYLNFHFQKVNISQE